MSSDSERRCCGCRYCGFSYDDQVTRCLYPDRETGHNSHPEIKNDRKECCDRWARFQGNNALEEWALVYRLLQDGCVSRVMEMAKSHFPGVPKEEI